MEEFQIISLFVESKGQLWQSDKVKTAQAIIKF